MPAWLAAIIGAVLPWIFILAGSVATRSLDGRLDGLGAGATFLRPALANLLVLGPFLLFALAAVSWQGRARPVGQHPLKAGALGLALGLGGFCAVIAVLRLAGVLTAAPGQPVGAAAGLGLLAAVGLFAFQVAAEEAFFRRWLQPIVCAAWGPWVGLATTAVLFAAAHWASQPWGALASVNLVLAGAMFGLLALRTGGLWAPFLAHLGWNVAESSGFGLEPNPGIDRLGALVDFDAVGPPIWTGGADRLNGSLASTLVLATIVLALVLVRGRRAAALR